MSDMIPDPLDALRTINVNDDTTKLLKACVEYRAMMDRLERENAELRVEISAYLDEEMKDRS